VRRRLLLYRLMVAAADRELALIGNQLTERAQKATRLMVRCAAVYALLRVRIPPHDPPDYARRKLEEVATGFVWQLVQGLKYARTRASAGRRG
jgi:hypothetical protein